MTESLSPSAQAVLYAAHNAPEGRDSYRMSAAAALRAAADQVMPVCSTRSDRGMQRMMIRNDLRAIADELDPPSS